MGYGKCNENENAKLYHEKNCQIESGIYSRTKVKGCEVFTVKNELQG